MYDFKFYQACMGANTTSLVCGRGKMKIPYVPVIGGGSVLLPAIMDGTTRLIRSAKVY
jgi:hypothetical protein